tara:strand:+ start:29 stop:505 length:477 start_codon:yes stop_codon:yes gene_type:complete
MKLFLLNVFFFLSFGSYSQSVISSSGNTKNNGDFILSWTIGEGVISTIGNNDKELTQGFHQPLSVDVIAVGIEDDFILDIKAYPNPTFDMVMFEGGDPVGIYHIRVVDKSGRILEQKSIPFQGFVLEMQKYNNGTYLVEVVEDKSGKRKIFNIVKSQK